MMTLPQQLTDFIDGMPISIEATVVLTMLAFSLLAAVFALIRNRPSLTSTEGEDDTDLGVLFENPSSVIPHLNELRDRVIKILGAVIITSLIAAVLRDPIFIVLLEPIGGYAGVTSIDVTEQIQAWFRVSITLGIMLSAPYVISQIWIFVAAGLKRSERRWFYTLFPFALLLFGAGVAFAYFAMLPTAIPFLVSFLFDSTPTINSYIDFVTTIILFVGLSFEMPLIIYLLAKANVVTHTMLLNNWRIAIVLIAVLAAVVTPTADPLNMAILAAPLVVLYLLSIILARFA